MKKFIINNLDYKNLRIDKWLKINFSMLNQAFIEKNLRKGYIKIGKKKILSKYKLQINDEIIIYNYKDDIYYNKIKKNVSDTVPSKYQELFKKNILFENDNFIILDKWSGIATQGGSKIQISVDQIIKKISDKYNLVHRLDRETSGLLIIAKNLVSTRYFGNLFKNHLIEKVYVAICQGSPKNIESEINLLITDKKDINKKHNSITKYKNIQTNNKLSNIIFAPKTGKTHQIRIVAKHLGCPIVGDTKYNIQNKYNSEKLKLNAHFLKFSFKNHNFEFKSNLPDDFLIFYKKNNLRIANPGLIKSFL